MNIIDKVDIINSEISVKGGGSVYAIRDWGGASINIKNSNITAIYTGTQPDYYRAYGIYASSGNVSIGEKDSTELDTTKITSTNIGVYGIYGKINYYGGTIEGGENAIQGSIGDTPTNKTIYVEDEDKKISLIDKEEKVIAKIGDNEFTSLAKAVHSVEENKEEYTEIQLVANSEISTLEEEVNISENQKIKIDLNGNTVISYRNSVINNKGQLEILDSSELKEGKIESAFRAGIDNQGDFTLDSGNITGVVYCIYNTKGNIEMKGGTLELNSKDRSNTTAIYAGSQTDNIKLLGGNIICIREKMKVRDNYNSYLSAIFINKTNLEVDGTYINVENSTNYYTYGIICSKSNINIKSGDINVRSTSNAGRTYGIAGRSSYDNEDGNNINISGGNIVAIGSANIDTICLRSYDDTDKLTITGGKIESNGTVITAYPRKNNISVDFLGGTIISTDGSGIYGNTNNTYGTETEITIGKKDENVIRENPYIECKYIAVLGDNVKFYDGTIKAATAFSKMPTEIEPGYKVKISTKDDIQTATLDKVGVAEAKAKIGSLYFNDFQQAINACSESDTIEILASSICTETLKIQEGKSVKIDLMGNDLIASGIENIIENYGTLTIIDSIGGGSIKGNIDNHGILNR